MLAAPYSEIPISAPQIYMGHQMSEIPCLTMHRDSHSDRIAKLVGTRSRTRNSVKFEYKAMRHILNENIFIY